MSPVNPEIMSWVSADQLLLSYPLKTNLVSCSACGGFLHGLSVPQPRVKLGRSVSLGLAHLRTLCRNRRMSTELNGPGTK